MVMGLIYSLLVVAFTLNYKAWMNWFLQATAIYLCLMVPTVDIKVTDRVNPSLAPATIDNVPLGLGVLASFTTQIGDWMTRTAETVFVMPGELNYTTNGMVYGARLFDATRNFVIRDAEFATNLEKHFKNCVFGDVMLNQKSLTELSKAQDLWAAIGAIVKLADPPTPSAITTLLPVITGVKLVTVFTDPAAEQSAIEQFKYLAVAL
jgi:conjugal transfer mating pair stabilization protein TraG